MQKTKANILFGLSDRCKNCDKASLDGDLVTSFTLLSSSGWRHRGWSGSGINHHSSEIKQRMRSCSRPTVPVQCWSHNNSDKQQLQTFWCCCVWDMLSLSNFDGSSWETSKYYLSGLIGHLEHEEMGTQPKHYEEKEKE